MIAVAVIGLDVAAARAYFSSESGPIQLLSHQCAIMVLAAQVALYLAARARRHRLFWLGFTALGMIGALSMIADPPGIAGLWSSYFSWQGGLLLRSPEILRFVASHRGLLSLVAILSYGVPQLVLGIAGGLLAVGVVRIVQGRRRGEVPAGDA
jgi:hypothetical protein